MKQMSAISIVALLMLAEAGSGDALDAAKSDDHELALQALRRGEVLPITRILAITRARLPGEIVEIELEGKDGRIYYEVKILTRNGAVRELLLDARTGAFIAVKDD